MRTSSPPPPYTISFLPPPGPAVLSLQPTPSSQHLSHPSVPPTFHDALTIRYAVFVDEQNCPADEDVDADDAVSWHWVIHAHDDDDDDGASSGSVPAATIRLLPARTHGAAHGHDGGDDAKAEAVFEGPCYGKSKVWDREEPYAMIGRLATRKEFRGRGYGRVLVEEALRWAGGHGGDVVGGLRGVGGERVEWKGLLLAHGQERVEGWYQSIGWRTDEGMGRWDECGIQHVGMWRRVEVEGREASEEKGS